MKNASTLAFIAAAAVVVILVAFMYPQRAVDPAFARKESLPGVQNFARLSPEVWRGRAPDAEGLQTLKNMGVRTIIDFRTSDEHEQLAEDPEIRYIRLPFSATDPPPQEVVDTFMQAVTDPDMLPVFFHCRHGKDRTGAMAALYRIRVQGWEPETAIREMKYFGFRAIYRDLLKFVRSQEPATVQQK